MRTASPGRRRNEGLSLYRLLTFRISLLWLASKSTRDARATATLRRARRPTAASLTNATARRRTSRDASATRVASTSRVRPTNRLWSPPGIRRARVASATHAGRSIARATEPIRGSAIAFLESLDNNATSACPFDSNSPTVHVRLVVLLERSRLLSCSF